MPNLKEDFQRPGKKTMQGYTSSYRLMTPPIKNKKELREEIKILQCEKQEFEDILCEIYNNNKNKIDNFLSSDKIKKSAKSYEEVKKQLQKIEEEISIRNKKIMIM